jgi:XTP/dITP diphosphohydrolase
MRYLLATRSTDKAREIRQILADTAAEIVTLDELGVPPSEAEEHIETFDSFRGNALAKARYFRQLTGMPTIADDSGIEVTALNGAPGVLSRRFSGRTDLSGKALDAANNATLLDRLASVPDSERTARYICAATLLDERQDITAIGSVSGLILHQPAGSGGFGYDPLFFLPQKQCTFAELPASVKHAWSHRGRAFRALAATCLRK